MRLCLIVFAAVLLSACGGNSSPTAPTPVAPAPPPVVVVVPPPPPPPSIANYAGRWAGNYIVEQCAGSSGSMDDLLCSAPRGNNPGGIFQRGASFSIALDLTQNGSGVGGSMTVGQMRGTVTGSVGSDQSLLLAGAATGSDASVGLVVTTTIAEWNTFLQGSVMEGNVAFNIRANVFPGDGVVRVRLSNVRR